jgi:hypothetical protein
MESKYRVILLYCPWPIIFKSERKNKTANSKLFELLYFIFHKQFYFVIFGLKTIGHGKPDNNLESLCISYSALGNSSLASILRHMNPV